MNINAIKTRLQASKMISTIEEVPDGLEITTTVAATDQPGSTERLHALIITAVRDGGGYSRHVSSSETGFTANGAGIWHIAAQTA